MAELGTDVDASWTFTNGDLKLIKDEENLKQAVVNRINCYKPNLEVYYDFYGGFLVNYFGRKQTIETLKFMEIELNTILRQDPRITDFSSNIEYDKNGAVKIDLVLLPEEAEITMNLILNGETVVEEEDAD